MNLSIDYGPAIYVGPHRDRHIFREYNGYTVNRDIHVYATLEDAINSVEKRHCSPDAKVNILACIDYERFPPQLIWLKQEKQLKPGDCIAVGDNGQHYSATLKYVEAVDAELLFCVHSNAVQIVGYIQ